MRNINLPINHLKALSTALTIAKKTILVNWKNKQTININHWLNLLLEHITNEKMSGEFRNQQKHFTEKWSPFLKSINLSL